ncbi:APC family permease [Saccharothrix sp. AJ9571]|nr:APC family permease [Saccharothrix sp. AJ9571]
MNDRPARPSPVSQALASDRLGASAVVFFVISAATPLTVVAGVVTTGYATTGLIGIPVAFVFIALVLALFSVGYVAMARHVAIAGAFYGFISRGLGKPFGVGAAWIALLSYNLLQVGLYGAAGAAAAPLFREWFGTDLPWWVFALAAWVLVAALGLQHVDVNGKVLAVLLAAEVAVIAVYSVSNVANPAGGEVSFATLAPAELFGPGAGAILALAVLGFVGFESSVVFSEEVRNPQRTVAVATYVSLAAIGGLYAFASWAMSVATGPDRIVGESQAQSSELLFSLADSQLGHGMATAGRVLFVTSILAAMISFHNTIARYTFALGREGVLPAALGRTSPRTGSPVAGSMIQSGVGLAVIGLFALAGWDPLVHLFFWGGNSGGLGVLVLIVATSFSVVLFFARQPSGENLWRRLIAPALASLAVLVVLVLVLVNFGTLLGVPPESPLPWLVPVIHGLVGLAGVLWALVLRIRRPQVYSAIGLGAKNKALAGPEDYRGTHL